MEINDICFATLSTGSKVKLTLEAYNQFCEAERDDYIQLNGGRSFKKSSVMEIQDISEYYDEEKYQYGQRYTPLPAGVGINGVIGRVERLSALEAMARGLKKAKAQIEATGKSTPNIDSLLDFARQRYSMIRK